ncbi:hypothetical protein PIROE2DRAFT_15562 [Piromyces sp. E2]|nr:hypothetical protein PIROE2DRAFT_15562 [Piromyces sp. E2]|eukprot:OUM59020.1 hypothetical protein PIROE2DRAFT_15562 [Piromyces sp. E2]
MNDVYLRPPTLEPEKKHSIVSQQCSIYKSYDTMHSNFISSSSIGSMAVSESMNYFNEDYEDFPRILHIPSSITCQNDFSWGFWNWIHSKDNVYQDNVIHDTTPIEDETVLYTKVFTQDGTQLPLKSSYQHHSKHFHIERNNIPTPKSEAIANQHSLNSYVKHNADTSNITANTGPAIQGLNPTTVPRFYIQVMNFKGEHFNNGIAPCHKMKDGTVIAKFNEAFVL